MQDADQARDPDFHPGADAAGARREAERLDVVASLGLDRSDAIDFGDIVTLAAESAAAPIALVTIVEKDRQVFHAAIGLAGTGTPRDQSFCAHAIDNDEVLWVEDARRDPRFADNPLVTGAPGIVLYAGAPIFVDGRDVGSLCVIDHRPRSQDAALCAKLKVLAAIAARRLSRNGPCRTATGQATGTRICVSRTPATRRRSASG